MVAKTLNKKNNIQSFISLIFIFIFSFVNFFYLIQLEVIQGDPNDELRNVLTKPQLGEILIKGNEPTKSEIIDAVKQQNPDLNNKHLDIVGSIGNTKAKISSNEYINDVEVTYILKQKTSNKPDLKTILKKLQLGEILIKGNEPTKSEIIDAVKQQNPDLNNKHLDIVGSIGNTKAKISSNEYINDVEVTYSLKQKTSNKPDLKTILKKLQLGEILIKGNEPTKSEIIDAVKQQNPDLNNKHLDIVGSIGNTKAKISSNEYINDVEVTYSLKKIGSSFNIWWFSLILSLILAILALVGYYFYKKNNNILE